MSRERPGPRPAEGLRRSPATGGAAGVLGLLLSCCGCGAGLQSPTLTPQRATVVAVGPSGLSMRIEATIHNPNSTELAVRSIRARVSAQGEELGSVERQAELRLPPGEHTRLAADLTVPWLRLPSLGLGAVLGGGIPYRVAGTVVVAAPAGISLEVPFEMDGQMPASALVGLPAAPSP